MGTLNSFLSEMLACWKVVSNIERKRSVCVQVCVCAHVCVCVCVCVYVFHGDLAMLLENRSSF